jgi:hypothetical protein
MEDRVTAEIDQLFEELHQLLKNPEVGHALAARGVNTSLAMTLADGMRAYLQGKKEQAIADLSTAVEEITARWQNNPGGRPS